MYLMLLLIILGFVIYLLYRISEVHKNDKDMVYVSMTTIPERLSSDWFYNNLKKVFLLRGNYKIILNIPWTFKKTGEAYVIPERINKLIGKKFSIYRCEDVGPLTKLWAALYNKTIPDEAAILICDDDIHYKEDIIKLLYQKYKQNKKRVYCMCTSKLEGFKSFMLNKSLVKPILKFKRPESCFRVDDDFIEVCLKKLNIKTVAVPYYKDTS